ncbi:MAG: hypothetical protein PUF72_03475 [Clostridiales bacterium]|nr:hypothetical protein [Clostridiales bacterium]
MNTNRNDTLNELIEHWEEFNENLFYDNRIDLEEFKALFTQTWRYFSSAEPDDERISLRDTELLGLMTPITRLNCYPDETACSQFDACVCFVKGLCQSIVYPNQFYDNMKFYDGWIRLPQYDGFHCGTSPTVYIDNFEEEFNNLCDYYFTNVYDEDEELDNRL